MTKQQHRRFIKKLKIELPDDPVILLVGIYPKEKKSLSQRAICTPMFTEAFAIIVKLRTHASNDKFNHKKKKPFNLQHYI